MIHANYPPAHDMPSADAEAERRRVLAAYGILDTGAEQAFDDLTALASQLCQAPASIITFIDGNRLWFKSTYGLTATEAPVQHSFCAHAAGAPGEVFTVEDALADERFARNVFVMPADGLRAYAGANIVDPGTGHALGSICVVDFRERAFTDEQREALERLSRQVVDQLELRRRVATLERQTKALAAANAHFERFSHVVAHDIRGPLVTQRGLLEALREDHGDALAGEGADLLAALERGAARTLDMVGDLMRYLRDGSPDGRRAAELVRIDDLFAAVRERVDLPAENPPELSFERGDLTRAYTQPVVLEHILLNLVNNAVKYIGRPDGHVRVIASTEGPDLKLCVVDNGPGIPAAERERAFAIFSRGASSEGTSGSGLGLAMSQRLATSIGGSIELDDVRDEAGEVQTGCHFSVRVPLAL